MSLSALRQGPVVALGEPFRLQPGGGVHLADGFFQLERRGASERIAVLCRDARRVESPLSELPVQIDRCRIELVDDRGDEASFRCSEAAVEDDAFLTVPSFVSGRTLVTPERPHRDWRGIRIAAPRRVDLARAREAHADAMLNQSRPLSPKVIVAGCWCATKAELATASKAHWAMTASPTIVVTDLRREQTTRQLVDELYDGYMHQVVGMNISWAQPPELPEVDHDHDQDVTTGGVFHADIGTLLAPLSGLHHYRVYAEIGPHRAEAVEILVRGD